MATEHPFLYLTSDFVRQYRLSGRGAAPLFDRSLADEIALADKAIASGTDIPVPKEASGEGSSNVFNFHRQALQAAAAAWQFTSDKKYAEWIRDILLAYSKMYPTLGWHPESGHSGEPGRLYYQMLDDCEWTVRAAMAYDCIYDFLSRKERKQIENDLLIPSARFLMEGTADNPKNEFVFNRMHNHGTWADLAVGFVGLVTGTDEFVSKSLYGTDLSGQHGGLLQQIDELFSPDGYYYEGAYYQGYALIPMLMYAQCLDRVMPELDIFHRNGSALLKSAEAMFSLSYRGRFFKMNDSGPQRIDSPGNAYAIDIVYAADPSQKKLLSIAGGMMKKVLVCEAGYKTALDIRKGEAEEMNFGSMMIRDGKDGGAGAIMVLRSSDGQDVLTLKACGQGGYHGHFDKLAISYFSDGDEVIRDYGFARYPSLSWKENGRYTALNRSYAMTTVAHNTLVVDTTSHFGGVTPHALPYSPRVLGFNADKPEFQYMGAVDSCAVPGVRMERWCAMVKADFLEKPVVIDILRASGESGHLYDLPFHYEGQLMNLSVPMENNDGVMRPAGSSAGYRHLWKEAGAKGADGAVSLTFLQGERFHTVTTLTDPATEISLLRLGANDPDFILDRHPALMLRKKGRSVSFVSCIETHGRYDRGTEHAADVKPSCRDIRISEDNGTSVRFTFEGGQSFTVRINNDKMTIE